MFNIFKNRKKKINKSLKWSLEEDRETQLFEKTEKALPSGTPIFTMREMDWGVHCRVDTDCWEYYVYSDGRVEFQYNGCLYGLPLGVPLINADDHWSGLITKTMERKDFVEFQKLLKKFPENCAHISCCDGTGYEMTMYDSEGNILHTTCGYIYDIKILEKIAELVKK